MNPGDIYAFPRPASPASGTFQFAQEGMTLRDYFAAKAMHGLINELIPEDAIAIAAYEIADAMLKAREGK